MERETRVELATSTLARSRSTTELLPPCTFNYKKARLGETGPEQPHFLINDLLRHSEAARAYPSATRSQDADRPSDRA
jgi:hypothetical protein